MGSQTYARTAAQRGARLMIVVGALFALTLSAGPAQAARLWFGTQDYLVKIQDVDIKGPGGEALYLGYKYSFHCFALPYSVTNDGYILGVRGQNRFLKLDEARIQSFQANGSLPSPLPPYELSLVDYAMGYSLWIALLIIVALIPVARYRSLRRKRALRDFEGAVADHRTGDLDKAIDGYTRAIEVDPTLAAAFHLRGKAFEGKGDERKAISDYTAAIRIEPKLASALWDRGTLLRNMRQFETAISDFSRVVKLTKDAAAHVQRGYIYLLQGDLDRAIADFTTAIKKAPDYADAYRYRSLAYEKQGQAASAAADDAKARAIAGNVGSLEPHAAHAS
jgi:tetratricopeptide (TPR) repeat protein